MKKLVYRLTNGKVVSTLREAVTSGQGYKTEYITIFEPTVISEKRAEVLAKNGYVKPPQRLAKW